MNIFKKCWKGIASVVVSVFVPKKYRDLSNAVISTVATVDKISDTIESYVNVATNETTGKLDDSVKNIVVAKTVEMIKSSGTKIATAAETITDSKTADVKAVLADTRTAGVDNELVAKIVSLIGCYELLLHLHNVQGEDAQRNAVKAQINGLKREISAYLLEMIFSFSKNIIIKYIEDYFYKKALGK